MPPSTHGKPVPNKLTWLVRSNVVAGVGTPTSWYTCVGAGVGVLAILLGI
jgi:hypothetical protein